MRTTHFDNTELQGYLSEGGYDVTGPDQVYLRTRLFSPLESAEAATHISTR